MNIYQTDPVEYKVYVLPLKEEYEEFINKYIRNREPFTFTADLLAEWALSDVLPPEAVKFIELCEQNGSVYSLRGFQYALNWGEFSDLDIEYSYVLITNKY